MKRLLVTVFVAILGAAMLHAGGGQEDEALGASPAGTATKVTVASKIDTEGAVLGGMIVRLLAENGFTVEDRTEFGTTEIIRQAVISGEIDIYPEYTGNGGFFFPETDPSVWKDPDLGYETVRALDLERNGLVWLEPAPANNTWAVAVRRDLADAEGLATLEDFARFVNRGGGVKLAGSEEFVSRPDALPAFEEAYGFSLKKEQLVILSGGNTAMTEQAAANRIDGVNTAMAYGTDGQLAALGLVVLEDSLHVQPVYRPAPLVRKDFLDRHPEIAAILAPVFRGLDLETLQELNARVAVGGEEAGTVAEDYLRERDFLR
jgi:osmoprotectant transport system substrate-binding protein